MHRWQGIFLCYAVNDEKINGRFKALILNQRLPASIPTLQDQTLSVWVVTPQHRETQWALLGAWLLAHSSLITRWILSDHEVTLGCQLILLIILNIPDLLSHYSDQQKSWCYVSAHIAYIVTGNSAWIHRNVIKRVEFSTLKVHVLVTVESGSSFQMDHQITGQRKCQSEYSLNVSYPYRT